MATDSPIKPLVPGQAPTMLEAAKGNEVIRSVNKILGLRVQWVTSGMSRLEVTGENAVLYISTADMP